MKTRDTETIHAEVTKLPAHSVAQRLIDALGPALVALLAEVRDRKLPYRWAKPVRTAARMQQERLLIALRAWEAITQADGPDTARAWFIGANPRLDEQSPAIAIRDGRYLDVIGTSVQHLSVTRGRCCQTAVGSPWSSFSAIQTLMSALRVTPRRVAPRSTLAALLSQLISSKPASVKGSVLLHLSHITVTCAVCAASALVTGSVA
ncbi:hypothetical protein ONR57_12315 [Hoyosella sp. YIM 151337]|uniref:hypothetical protein n=1 Tax=Hoyosella sp. YIM 151337 TaxID=2992742 RepID=UPI0022362FCA|nr:hypothetical protein [Hoyosella sp. YIM 151337]MCW4354085.1 hypothetical protein [Hoyosella sp. YIM 151337]